VGSFALYNLTTGNYNLGLGYKAGENLTSGSGNIIIGYDIDAPSATGSNQLNIGNLIFGTNLDGRNTTLSSGNVGIGTTNPSYKLSTLYATAGTDTVASSFQMGTKSTGDMVDGFGGGFLFAIQDDTSTLNNIATIYGLRDGADNSGALTFSTYSGGTRGERLRITSTGNVGIGTTTPGAKLDIAAGNLDLDNTINANQSGMITKTARRSSTTLIMAITEQ